MAETSGKQTKQINDQYKNIQNQFINIFEAAQKQQEKKPQKKQTKQLKPQPLADPKLTKKICQLIQQLTPLKQVKKGVNEILKQMTKGTVQVVIMAADCQPLQVVMTLPPLCEQRNVQYCFIPHKAVLGRACGIKTPVAAAGLIAKQGSQLSSQILELKDKIQQLLI